LLLPAGANTQHPHALHFSIIQKKANPSLWQWHGIVEGVNKKNTMNFSTKKATETFSGNLINLITDKSHALKKGLEPLYDRIGNAKIVMLGEASHGTHEYYHWRAHITKHLIQEKGFNIIGVEGDWPDCYRINRYIRNYGDSGKNAAQVLRKFHRWPTWMWANWEIAALMEWLKEHNQHRDFDHQAGFYGLDVYSLWESLEAIREYLKNKDPDALKTVEEAISCFEPYNKEASQYATSTRFTPESCEGEVLELLAKIRKKVPLYNHDREAPFNTEQNAMTAVNAERYYRAMVRGGPQSWNIRDEHMTATLERLLDFHGPDSKAVIWEHNTHIGDARATDMKSGGMVNVGQLVREKWGAGNTVAVGFGSYKGSVIAAQAWDAPMEKMQVPEARESSWESLLHESGADDKLILTHELKDHPRMAQPFDHRAIGVIYHPERERYGNYVPSLIPVRYDAFIFLNESSALHPIKVDDDPRLVPETYPWGI
jgi:erythromycin esterase